MVANTWKLTSVTTCQNFQNLWPYTQACNVSNKLLKFCKSQQPQIPPVPNISQSGQSPYPNLSPHLSHPHPQQTPVRLYHAGFMAPLGSQVNTYHQANTQIYNMPQFCVVSLLYILWWVSTQEKYFVGHNEIQIMPDTAWHISGV